MEHDLWAIPFFKDSFVSLFVFAQPLLHLLLSKDWLNMWTPAAKYGKFTFSSCDLMSDFYVCTYVCMYVCMYICMYLCCMYACKCVCVCVCVCARLRTCECAAWERQRETQREKEREREREKEREREREREFHWIGDIGLHLTSTIR